MICIECSVLPSKDGWVVHCAATQRGPYLSRGIALRVAINQSLELRRLGVPSKISVQDERERVCAEQCLCSRFPRYVARDEVEPSSPP